MKAIELPTGKHFAYFRQFNAFDAIQPVRLNSGIWVMPETAIDYIDDKYLKASKKIRDAHPGIVQDVLDMIDYTVIEARKLSSVDIPDSDAEDRFNKKHTHEEELQKAIELASDGIVDESMTIAELKGIVIEKDKKISSKNVQQIR